MITARLLVLLQQRTVLDEFIATQAGFECSLVPVDDNSEFV